jgi:hypothetical protein
LAGLLSLAAGLRADTPRTSAPKFDSSQAVGSVWEAVGDASNRFLAHKHDGSDGSSRLSSPFVEGTVILQSANGSCWSCGPDNAGTWACASAACP